MLYILDLYNIKITFYSNYDTENTTGVSIKLET